MNVDASGPEKKGLRAVLTCKRYFTYKEIVGITANFRSLIAQAAFSDVYYGRLEDGVEVAVKMRGSKVAYDEVDPLSLSPFLQWIETICMDITNFRILNSISEIP